MPLPSPRHDFKNVSIGHPTFLGIGIKAIRPSLTARGRPSPIRSKIRTGYKTIQDRQNVDVLLSNCRCSVRRRVPERTEPFAQRGLRLNRAQIAPDRLRSTAELSRERFQYWRIETDSESGEFRHERAASFDVWVSHAVGRFGLCRFFTPVT